MYCIDFMGNSVSKNKTRKEKLYKIPKHTIKYQVNKTEYQLI